MSAAQELLAGLPATREWQEDLHDGLRVTVVGRGAHGSVPPRPGAPGRSPTVAPLTQPTIGRGTRAIVVATMAYLAKVEP